MVYYCDICGSPINGDPIVAKIEGATLILCEACSKKYAVTSKRSLKSIKFEQSQQRVQAVTPSMSSGVYMSVRVHEGLRGTTFRIITKKQESKIKIKPERFEIIENFPEVVRTAREKMGLSREDLAKLLGVKESIVRRIEEGQLMPDVELARKLEKVLKVKLLVPAQEEVNLPLVKESSHELTLGDIVEIRRRDEE